MLKKNTKSRGWDSSSFNFDLLDLRTGEVIGIASWLGDSAGGGLNEANVLKRKAERKLLRLGSE